MSSQRDQHHLFLIAACLVPLLCFPMAAQETPPLAQPDTPTVLHLTFLARLSEHPFNRIGELLLWNIADSLQTESQAA